jgi:hypothetical protein
MTLEQSDYFLIFELMTKNSNITIKDLKMALPHRPNKKTVTKARNVAEQLMKIKEQPPSDEQKKQIADSVAGYDGTVKYVNDVYNQLIAWRRKMGGNELSIIELSIGKHLNDLIELASSIRHCIVPPNLDEEPDYHHLMNVMGYDWRLDPVMWFYLCTPDLNKVNSWPTEPALLKSHIESNPSKKSPFWEHMEELWQKVKALESVYDKRAVDLMKEDKNFKEYWESIQFERVKREDVGGYKPSRTPLSLSLIIDVKPYYDESKVDEVIREFEKIKDFLEGDQFELEQILNQLYKDLNPNEINDIIINGRCKKCP